MVSVEIFSSDDMLELLERWNVLSNLSARPAFRKINSYILFSPDADFSVVYDYTKIRAKQKKKK